MATLDIGEVYIRTPDGRVMRMAIEEVPPEDVEGWGISFDPD